MADFVSVDDKLFEAKLLLMFGPASDYKHKYSAEQIITVQTKLPKGLFEKVNQTVIDFLLLSDEQIDYIKTVFNMKMNGVHPESVEYKNALVNFNSIASNFHDVDTTDKSILESDELKIFLLKKLPKDQSDKLTGADKALPIEESESSLYKSTKSSENRKFKQKGGFFIDPISFAVIGFLAFVIYAKREEISQTFVDCANSIANCLSFKKNEPLNAMGGKKSRRRQNKSKRRRRQKSKRRKLIA
jgi:hypothetical protein